MKRFKKWLSALTLVVLALGLSVQPISTVASQEVKVQDFATYNQIQVSEFPREHVGLVRVVDGDTVILKVQGKSERVRLIGIDTPESVHPNASLNSRFGEEASRYTEKLLKENSGNLYLELDVEERDRYGRLLGYLWIGDQQVNEALLRQGYAQLATYPPNTRYVDQYTEAQHEARRAERGFWAADSVTVFAADPAEAETRESTSTSPATSSQEAVAESVVEPVEETVVEEPAVTTAYIGNANTMKFHYPGCHSVKRMAEHNKVNLSSRELAISSGYVPCKNCNP